MHAMETRRSINAGWMPLTGSGCSDVDLDRINVLRLGLFNNCKTEQVMIR